MGEYGHDEISRESIKDKIRSYLNLLRIWKIHLILIIRENSEVPHILFASILRYFYEVYLKTYDLFFILVLDLFFFVLQVLFPPRYKLVVVVTSMLDVAFQNILSTKSNMGLV